MSKSDIVNPAIEYPLKITVMWEDTPQLEVILHNVVDIESKLLVDVKF